MNVPCTLRFFRVSRIYLVLLLLLACFFCLSSLEVHAQSGAGVSIKPAQIEKTLDPGTVEQHTLSIENLTSSEQTYYLFVRNISGVGPGGVPVFATTNDEVTGYEIADWINLASSSISIPSGAARSVNFSLNIPNDASPGSHFGGIFVSVEPPEIDTVGAAIGYQVASIVSIRVSGDVFESANVRQFSTDKYLYSSQNVQFSIRIENEGNVLVRPSGMIELFNMLGKRVDVVQFNPEGRAVFPVSTRDYFDINWEGEGVGFGRYEAMLSIVYGDEGAKKTMTSTATFWILPMHIIGPALLGLVVTLLISFLLVRLYIKRSLEHLSGGRRMVSRRRNRNSSATMLLVVVMLTVTALFLIILLALFA